MSRVLVSASHKSSGKTTVAIGLADALAGRGLAVQTFKKGPDYIDPMWLSRASGRACYNLDFNTQSHDDIRRMFARRAKGADLALVEGNMGLHDGVDLEGADTTAALARLLSVPVILVIDCEGMARSVAPLVLGFQAFDPCITIGGIILNRIASSRQEGKIRAALERYTSIPVLGALSRAAELTIIERHIGLTTPGEAAHKDLTIARLGQVMRESVDLDRLLAIAATAAPLEAANMVPVPAGGTAKPITIAVARDEAFGFYYADDLDALAACGARVVPFSPIHDARLPESDALFIGGGFPETHMAQLEANAGMREAIRQAADAGLPIYAECGGLMYLSRSIRWGDEARAMCGVIEGDIIMHKRPQGSGLVVFEETAVFPWPAAATTARGTTVVRAHEFHHAQIVNLPSDTQFAWRMRRGQGIDGEHDGIVSGNVLASFSHLRDTSTYHWSERFTNFIRDRKVALAACENAARAHPLGAAANGQESTL